MKYFFTIIFFFLIFAPAVFAVDIDSDLLTGALIGDSYPEYSQAITVPENTDYIIVFVSLQDPYINLYFDYVKIDFGSGPESLAKTADSTFLKNGWFLFNNRTSDYSGASTLYAELSGDDSYLVEVDVFYLSEIYSLEDIDVVANATNILSHNLNLSSSTIPYIFICGQSQAVSFSGGSQYHNSGGTHSYSSSTPALNSILSATFSSASSRSDSAFVFEVENQATGTPIIWNSLYTASCDSASNIISFTYDPNVFTYPTDYFEVYQCEGEDYQMPNCSNLTFLASSTVWSFIDIALNEPSGINSWVPDNVATSAYRTYATRAFHQNSSDFYDWQYFHIQWLDAYDFLEYGGLDMESWLASTTYQASSTNILLNFFLEKVQIFQNLFPFNLPLKLLDMIANAEDGDLPSWFSIFPINDDNELVFEMTDSELLAGESVSWYVLPPEGLASSTEMQAFFDFTIIMSRYVTSLALLYGLYRLGHSAHEDF